MVDVGKKRIIFDKIDFFDQNGILFEIHVHSDSFGYELLFKFKITYHKVFGLAPISFMFKNVYSIELETQFNLALHRRWITFILYNTPIVTEDSSTDWAERCKGHGTFNAFMIYNNVPTFRFH